MQDLKMALLDVKKAIELRNSKDNDIFEEHRELLEKRMKELEEIELYRIEGKLNFF
jgi:hypothetical protein